MKKIVLALTAFLLTCGTALSQNLDIYSARDFLKDGPDVAVVRQGFIGSPEWEAFDGRVAAMRAGKAAEDPDIDDSLNMLKTMLRSAEEGGNKEEAESIRSSIAMLEDARQQARAMGKDAATPDQLKAELLKYAVGGRLFHSASLLFDDLAMVRDKSWDEAEYNAWGLMDANGKYVVPCRYEEFWSGSVENGRAPLIMASRMVDPDESRWEVSIFRPDGTLATQQKFTRATYLIMPYLVVGVCFQDGFWGLMDQNGRILTKKKYNLIDWNQNDLLDASQGKFVYGERDGVNYILSPDDGSEIGTFKITDDTHEVNYYPGKDPRK